LKVVPSALVMTETFLAIRLPGGNAMNFGSCILPLSVCATFLPFNLLCKKGKDFGRIFAFAAVVAFAAGATAFLAAAFLAAEVLAGAGAGAAVLATTAAFLAATAAFFAAAAAFLAGATVLADAAFLAAASAFLAAATAAFFAAAAVAFLAGVAVLAGAAVFAVAAAFLAAAAAVFAAATAFFVAAVLAGAGAGAAFDLGVLPEDVNLLSKAFAFSAIVFGFVAMITFLRFGKLNKTTILSQIFYPPMQLFLSWIFQAYLHHQ